MYHSPAPRASLLLLALLASCGTQAESRRDAPPQPVATPPSTTPVTVAIATPVASDPVTHPHAFSPTLAPPAFDRAAYLRDPAAYCAQSIPGRAWQVAAPSATTPLLGLVGASGFTCAPGQRVVLQARTEPGFPISFTSMGLGTFVASGLTTVTAAADADGVARADFAITPGTVGYVQITAGSPVRAGTLQFLVHVQE